MKRLTMALALAVAASACVDDQPTAPQAENKGTRAAIAWPSASFSLLTSSVPGGISPLIEPFAPGVIFDGNDDFVVGVLAFVGDEFSPFIALSDFSDGELVPMPGAFTAFNGTVAGGVIVPPLGGPFAFTSGLPFVQDFDFSASLPVPTTLVPLPLPTGGTEAEVNAMGAGNRPLIAGTVRFDDGSTRAVWWKFNTTAAEYRVRILPGTTPGQNSAAKDLNRRTIVGNMNGHPASWPIGDPDAYTDHTAIAGGFTGINSGDVVIGTQDPGGPGIFGPLAGPFDGLDFIPEAISDNGYVAGLMVMVGVLRLQTGALRVIPSGFGEDGGSYPLFLTENGLMGGVVLVPFFPVPIPQVWKFDTSPDTDGDKVPDGLDNCPNRRNGNQADDDNDYIGNLCQPPVPSITPSLLTQVEGGSIIFDAAGSTDPFGRRLTYEWDFGDGSPTSDARRVRHYFGDDGTFNVVLTADNGLATATDNVSIIIDNAMPRLQLTVIAPLPTTSSDMTLDLHMSDPGLDDTFTYRVIWGDGTPAARGECTSNPCIIRVLHRYNSIGVFEVRATVTDDDGAASATKKTTVNITE